MAEEHPVNLDEFLIAIDLDMFIYKNRLSTFEGKWRYGQKDDEFCTSERMAKAGFYCTGKGRNTDSAKCYVCQHELLWDAEDDPWEEHKKHRPDCQLVKMGKQDEAELTVIEILEIMAYSHTTKLYRNVEEAVRDLSALQDRLIANTEKMVG